MNISLLLGPEVDTAMQAARQVGSENNLGGLNAPIGGVLLGTVAEVWDHIELALRTAYRVGRDKATDLLDTAINAAESAIESAGNRAEQLQDAILARLQTFVRSLIQGALKTVDQVIETGGLTLNLDSVELGHTIKFGGSVGASITSVCQLTGEGVLSLSAVYKAG